MIPGKVYTPRDVIEAVHRRRWWIVVPFAVLGCAAFVYVMSLAYNYRSMATIQVLPDAAVTAGMRVANQVSLADRIPSINQETLTRTRLEQIISDLDLYRELRQSTVMENVISGMRTDITFQMTDRDMFQVGFTAKDPQVAHDVATRLTALFIDENARTRGQRADAAMQFLDTQVAEVRARLDAQEKQIEAYRLQYSGQLPSQLDANVQELNNSQLRLRSLSETVGRDRDQKLFLQRQLELAQGSGDEADLGVAGGTRGSTGAADGLAGSTTATELATAQTNLSALERRLMPDHPEVQQARRQVTALQQRAAAERSTTGAGSGTSAVRRQSPRVREIQAQIELVDRQIASRVNEERQLNARVQNYSQRVDAAPLRESELAGLTRDYEDTKRLHSNLVQRQQDAKMNANMERKDIGDRFRVIEPARLPEKPFSPSRRNYLLIGLIAAFVLSLGLAGVVEYRDSSVRTDEEITASLRLPVLATIPVLSGNASRRLR